MAKSPSKKPAVKAAPPRPVARSARVLASVVKPSNGKQNTNGKSVAQAIIKPIAKPSAQAVSAKNGAIKNVVGKTVVGKTVAGKTVATKPAAANAVAVKTSAVKPTAVKPGAVKPSDGKPVAINAAANKTNDVKAIAAKPDGQPVASTVRPPARARSLSSARRNEQRTNQALSESRSESSAASKKTKSVSARAAAAREADEQNQNLINNRPSAIPTDTKPRKNTAGLTTRELEFYRDLLLAKRRELVGDMSSMEREALRTTGGSNLSNLPIHMADMGTDNYEQEFTLGLMEKDRRLLRDINAALGKIQDGSYGICEGTGKPISKPRLEAQPWARYSIEHARKLERHMVR